MFDRVVPLRRGEPDDDYPSVRARTVEAADDSAPAPSRGDITLSWVAPEPLESAATRIEPGLFVIERMADGEWLPVHVAMASSGIGKPLRWLAAAPAILGVSVDPNSVRVRSAAALIDAARPSDRAALRALRDHVSDAIAGAGPTARLFTPTPPSPASRQLLSQLRWSSGGEAPPYLAA